MTQERWFQWGRASAAGAGGEDLREYAWDALLCGAVYPLPASERRTEGGIVPVRGFTLVLRPSADVSVGDRVRPLLLPGATYEIVGVGRYPGHTEAKAEEVIA